MATHRVLEGETWQSLADDFSVSLPDLLLRNGSDPGNPPPNPQPGSDVVLPGGPLSRAVAPENTNTIVLRSSSVHTLKMQLYDNDGSILLWVIPNGLGVKSHPKRQAR